MEKNGKVHKDTLYLANTAFENMNRTNVDLGDDDADGICNYYEEILGTDPKSNDTDKDGINDLDEVKFSGTDPSLEDTDKNGIKDCDEDQDSDGLTNSEEIFLGTSCITADTDGDTLPDGDEVNKYHTDPLKADTDGDGISDSQELELGYDSAKADSDGNGVEDGKEVKEQIKTLVIDEESPKGIKSVSVKLASPGHIDNFVNIQNTYNLDMRNTEVAGLVGVPAEFRAIDEFDSAEITFEYDESALGETDENDLRMLWYDDENDLYVPLEAALDTENNTLTYRTTHFSTYLVVDKKIWIDAMRKNINYRNSDKEKYYDMALVVDVSGSMQGERLKIAKQALNAFVDSTMGSDRVGLIKFESYSQKVADLTENASSLKSKINALSASGGTNADGGLSAGIKMLKENGSSNTPLLVLICDGDVRYSSSTIEDAQKNNIPIFCVNVVNGSSAAMNQIAFQAGGAYYYAATNKDIVNAVSELKGDTVSSVDVKDTDGDGLYDVYEVNGMMLSNGKIIYSDVNKKNSILGNATDAECMGIAPVTEQFSIDGETFTSVLWHAPVYNTLSPDFIYVDGRRNTDGSYIDTMFNYIPYSYSFKNANYVNPVDVTYKGETRTVNGADGVHNAFFDKLADKSTGDLLKFWGEISFTFILVDLIHAQAGDCFYVYMMGNGGPSKGLVEGSTRKYMNTTLQVDKDIFQVNSANDYLNANKIPHSLRRERT